MYIKGVGCTKFDAGNESSPLMVYRAVMEALDDADVGINEIDCAVVSNMDISSNGERQRHSSSMLSSLFQRKMPVISVTSACEGGSAALWTALQLGEKNHQNGNVLVIGFDRVVANTTESITDEIMMASERLYEQAEGLIFPAQYALVAQQHMLRYGTTSDDFASVSYKNHLNAYHNPKARFYGKKVTIDGIKKSPIISSPLRLFDCSISCNGAAALVLAHEKADVEIVGSAQATDCMSAFERADLTSMPAAKSAAASAFRQAGINPSDIGIAEVHDAFTPLEIIAYEDLGFAKPGEGMNLIRDGITNLDGSLPVNTSGGLKAKGHPISATGVSQIYELVKQLRGEAGDRQVSNLKYALAHNMGGVGSNVGVHILKKV